MTRGAYYNEIDPYAAQWLRNLIAAGHIAPGDVDERSITEVKPDDLKPYTQHHFFAGIGIWSYALRKTGWPDDQPIWTGSCPCQPFSGAGKGIGFNDERHLWPAWHWLISLHQPAVILGEQVASADGLAWLDLVHADLEATGYAVGAADLCAAGVGAPHIRQRLWFVGKGMEHAPGVGWVQRWTQSRGRRAIGGCGVGRMADTKGTGPSHGGGGPILAISAENGGINACGLAGTQHIGDRTQVQTSGNRQQETDGPANRTGGCGLPPSWLANAPDGAEYGSKSRPAVWFNAEGFGAMQAAPDQPGPTNGHWRYADWLFCTDGRWRAVEPDTFPLAHGAPSRVGRLRAYGNGITVEAAEAFIVAALY